MGAISWETLYQALIAERMDWSRNELLCAAAVLAAAAVIALALLRAGKIRARQAVGAVLLAAWGCFVIGYCVFARPPESRFDCQLELFWSWREAMDGDALRLVENVLNVFLLLPVGLLLPVVLDKRIPWWMGLLLGLLLSLGIEGLQYATHRGTFDVDDIFYNCVGCMASVIAGSRMTRRNRRDRRS